MRAASRSSFALPDNGVGHPSASLSHRFRQLGEEVPVDGPPAVPDQVAENEEEHGNRQQGAEAGQAEHHGVDGFSPQRPKAHGCAVPFRCVARISRRARPLRMIVRMKSTRPEFDQGVNVKVAGRFGELIGDDRGDGIAGGEQRGGDFGIIADDHGHGHRFTERPGHGQEDRAQDAGARVRHHDLPGGFPLGGAQRQRRLSLLHRHRQQDFPRNRDDKGNDHDGQNEPRRQQSHSVVGPLEEGQKAERRSSGRAARSSAAAAPE